MKIEKNLQKTLCSSCKNTAETCNLNKIEIESDTVVIQCKKYNKENKKGN